MMNMYPRSLGLLLRTLPSSSSRSTRLMSSQQAESFYDDDHKSMQRTLRKIIDNDINPNVDKWEAEGDYPAHQVFKKLGEAGLLGVNKPASVGGLGLDLKFNVAMNEELGNVSCGAIPMSIAVQTDMATPALARFGSDRLKEEFLRPSVTGDLVSCLGVSGRSRRGWA